MGWGTDPVVTTPTAGGWGKDPVVDESGGAAPAKAAPRVGPGETILNRAMDAIPLGRPVVNVGSTLGMQLAKLLGVGKPGVQFTDKAKQEMQERGIPVPVQEEAIPGIMETYRQARDTRNERTEAGAKQNKWSGRLGTGAGIALTLPWAAATALGSGIGGAAATGAAYGGLFGLTHGKADITKGEFGQATNDVLGWDSLKRAKDEFHAGNYGRAALNVAGAGALGGGATGGLAGAATQALSGPLAAAAENQALESGRTVLQGGSTISAATKRPVSDEAVREALQSGVIRPGSSTRAAFGRVEQLAETEGQRYAHIVSELEANGVQGPNAHAMAEQLMERYRQEFVNSSANKSVAEAYRNEAQNLGEIVKPPPGVEGPAARQLGLGQTENVKRAVQREARFDRLTASPAEEAKQEIASMYRQANEDAIHTAGAAAGPGSEVATLAEQFVPVKQRLGNLLEARTALEKAASKAAQREPLGLKDYLVGHMASGGPEKLALTLLSKVGRNRLPSTIASGAYGASQALRAGQAPSNVASWLSELRAPVANLPEMSFQQALADALRKRQENQLAGNFDT